ncbi:type II toxin-antitoxin system RelE/ParE family toxin, partial [Escherichia coli]|uniref:type II toxin-antitoxin system RelE family toxin n=1 Tax=Escherichia coli TaxID=562 RepID=UPI0021F3A27D
MFTIVATQQTAKSQLAKAFEDEQVKANIKALLSELSDMPDPRQHRAVCAIKCTHGMMYRLKVPPHRIVFRIYAIEDEVVVDVYAG